MTTRRSLTSVTIVGVVCLVAVGWSMVNAKRFYDRLHRAPSIPWKVVPDWRSYIESERQIGTSNASVVVIAFIDYDCDACQQFASRFWRLQANHPHELALVVRDFPVGSVPRATAAALATRCAARQHRFEPLVRAFFQSVDAIGTVPWGEVGRAAGVADTGAFASCMATANPDSMLRRDLDDAARLGVITVPTLLVNETAYKGLPWDFDRIIEEQVSRSDDTRKPKSTRDGQP